MSYVTVDVDIDDIAEGLSAKEKRDLIKVLRNSLGDPGIKDDSLDWLELMARGQIEEGFILLRRSMQAGPGELVERALAHVRDRLKADGQ